MSLYTPRQFTFNPTKNTTYGSNKNLRWFNHYLLDPYVHPNVTIEGIRPLKNGIEEFCYMDDFEKNKYLYGMFHTFVAMKQYLFY